MLKTANIDYISVLAYIETGKRNLSRQIMQKIDSLMSSDDINVLREQK